MDLLRAVGLVVTKLGLEPRSPDAQLFLESYCSCTIF